MTAIITGLGTASPKHRIDLANATKVAEQMSCSEPSQARKVEALYRRSGVSTRGSVLLEDPVSQSFYPALESADDRGPSTNCRSQRYQHEAPILATESAKQALQASGTAAADITHLVTVSCTGFSAPGVDIELIDNLGLQTTTERVQVGFMGCHGAINGLRAARGLVAADPTAKVLMCSVELCSLHYQYGFDADRIVSGALFADGSASLIIENDGDTTKPTASLGRIAATGSCLVPNSRDAMTWKIGNHGYEMTLAATVPTLIENQLSSFLEAWLAKQNLTFDKIGGWAVHPGGSRILGAVEKALDLDPSCLATSREVLAEHGNMSSATMLFILERFARSSKPKPWLMLGFGPGLEIEVALIH
ncbi:MAG: type III polyketide synthase [Pirellulaceae bacterium]|nr:type III polyketide synthase [Pirellulaceae bacterium]